MGQGWPAGAMRSAAEPRESTQWAPHPASAHSQLSNYRRNPTGHSSSARGGQGAAPSARSLTRGPGAPTLGAQSPRQSPSCFLEQQARCYSTSQIALECSLSLAARACLATVPDHFSCPPWVQAGQQTRERN